MYFCFFCFIFFSNFGIFVSLFFYFVIFIIIFFSCNHVIIGSLYIISGAIGGSVGLALSLLIRCEVMIIGFVASSAQQYNNLISFHGLFMIFFMIMPVLIGGFGNVLLFVMLGSSDLIFPRLNAASIWSFIASLLAIAAAATMDNGVNYLRSQLHRHVAFLFLR